MKIFRANLFFRASASCSKILNGKKCIQYSGKFHCKLVFQSKVKKFSIRYIQPIKAITAKFLVWENTTRKKLHPLELTSKVTTDFAYKGTSRRLHKGRYWRIEVISELKCMYSRRCHWDRTKCNVIGELTLPTKPL